MDGPNLPRPEIELSIFEHDWGQPELAAQRREHLLNGWVAGQFENKHELSQAEFYAADRVLTQMLENNGVNNAAEMGNTKLGILYGESFHLEKREPLMWSMDGATYLYDGTKIERLEK